MRRRDFLETLAATAVAGTFAAAGQPRSAPKAPRETSGRPDVLFILTDQWNPRCTGYAGETAVPTPNLDRLAAEGIVFENAYTPCPACMPARCSLLSGLYPHNHGLWGNITEYVLPPATAPLFRDIRQAGYATAQIGKLHWTGGAAWRRQFDSLESYHGALGLDVCEDIPEPFSTPQGHGAYQEHLRKIGRLDAYCRDIAERVEKGQYYVQPSAVGPEDYNDTFVAERAIDFLRAQPVDKPYCLVVSFPGPHPPMDAPGRYARLVPPENIVLPPNVPEGFSYERVTYNREGLQVVRANYYGKMALIDDQIGRLIEALRRRGTWEDTLVVFSADHGEMLGAQGHFSKGRFYEESARVPLLMRWPGRVAPGRRTRALAQLFDVYPTIVAAIGGKLSQGHFAQSLLPVATGAATAARDAVFSEIANGRFFNYMVRTRRYTWWIHSGKEALYDIEQDPYQRNNLIASASHADVLGEIRARHLEYFKTTQVNLSADYRPKLQRLAEEGGGKRQGLADRLYEQFRKTQAIDPQDEPAKVR